jgi:hypothetical protein
MTVQRRNSDQLHRGPIPGDMHRAFEWATFNGLRLAADIRMGSRAGIASQNFSADASPWPIDRGSSNDAEQFCFRVRTNSIRNHPRVLFGPP